MRDFFRKLNELRKRVAVALVVLFAIYGVVLIFAFLIEQAGYWPGAIRLMQAPLISTTSRVVFNDFEGRYCFDLHVAPDVPSYGDDLNAIRFATDRLNTPDLSDAEAVCWLLYRALAYERGRQRERVFDDRLEAAEADYAQMIEILPAEADLFHHRGFFYLRHHRLELAKADLEWGWKLDPDDWHFAYGLGRAAFETGDYVTSVGLLDTAVGLEADYPGVFYWRGAAEIRLEGYEAAVRDFDIVLSSDWPSNYQRRYAYESRAFANYRLGKLKLALNDVNAALEIDPASEYSKSLRDDILAAAEQEG